MTSTTATHPVPSPDDVPVLGRVRRHRLERDRHRHRRVVARRPDAYPDELDRPEADGSLVALVPPSLVSTLMVVLGAVGVLAAVAASRQDISRSRWLVPFGAVYAVVFGLLATDLSLLVSMGYITAIVGPPILFVYFVLASVRRPSLRWVVGGAAVAFVGIAAVSGAGLAAFGDFFGTIGDGLGKHGVGDARRLRVLPRWRALVAGRPAGRWPASGECGGDDSLRTMRETPPVVGTGAGG